MTPDQAIEIFKEERARFEATRTLQWKLNTSIWTLIVLAISQSEKMNFLSNRLFWFLVVTTAIAHTWYALKIQNNLAIDKANWNEILRQLNVGGDVKIDIAAIRKNRVKNLSNTMWVLFQITITYILLSVLVGFRYS